MRVGGNGVVPMWVHRRELRLPMLGAIAMPPVAPCAPPQILPGEVAGSIRVRYDPFARWPA